MEIICTWRPCGSYSDDEREEIHLSEESWKMVQMLQEWWAKHGEKIWNEYYGIERVEANGDLVIKDIDDYLEKLYWDGNWKPGEEEEEERQLRELIPHWDRVKDMNEYLEEQREKQREREERIKSFNTTVTVVRPKKDAEEEEAEKKPKKRSRKKQDDIDTISLLKNSSMKIAVDAIMKLLDDEIDEELDRLEEEYDDFDEDEDYELDLNDLDFDDDDND